MRSYWAGKWLLQQDLITSDKNGYSDKMFRYVFGRNSNVDNALVDLWEGPTARYVFPTVAQRMQIVSTDNTNDKAGGTGALQVMIHYLDWDYEEHEETLTMNGTTPVLTVATDILRVNRMHVISTWSNGVAAGTISLTNIGATVTYSLISAGLNTARQAIYTVKAGVNGYISHWQASSWSSGNHFTQMMIVANTHDGELINSFLAVDEVGTQNGGCSITLPIPVRIPEKTDVKMAAISDNAAANVIAMGAIMGWFETL